jgi:hypothetical protein
MRSYFTRQRVSESEAGVPAEIRVHEIMEAALRRRGAAQFSREQDGC